MLKQPTQNSTEAARNYRDTHICYGDDEVNGRIDNDKGKKHDWPLVSFTSDGQPVYHRDE